MSKFWHRSQPGPELPPTAVEGDIAPGKPEVSATQAQREWSYNDTLLRDAGWLLRVAQAAPRGFFQGEGPPSGTNQHVALGHLMDIESRTRLPELVASVPRRNRGEFIQRVSDYHASLPFADAERAWLAAQYETAGDQFEEQWNVVATRLDGYDTDWSPAADWIVQRPFDRVARTSGELVIGGRQVSVEGHDLLSQWERWLTAEGEFAGEPTILRAEFALLGIRRALTDRQHQLPPFEGR